MIKKTTIIHVKSGMSWFSDWEKTELEVSSTGYAEIFEGLAVSLKSGDTNIIIPPAILAESIRMIQYDED